MDSKLRKLFLLVRKELKKAEKNYNEAKKSASEVAASAAASPSQSGDRFHSQGALDLTKQRLDALVNLRSEIEAGEVIQTTKAGEEVFLVKNVAFVPGVKLVSVNSPVGKELRKNVG